MKVLVVGGGGREHALAWKLARSGRVQMVYVAPGNPGTAADARLKNIDITDIHALADFASQEPIALTVVGPEAPLAAGIVDTFRARGLKIFGPSQAAAQLESSKTFAKDFMRRHGIPTASYVSFEGFDAAWDYVQQQGAPIVIKADGLAAGKGVTVAMSLPQAHEALQAIFTPGQLGARAVLEAFMEGEEASFIVVSDGAHAVPLASSQDHKRLKTGDEGPNTGGMGAYSPAPVVTPNINAKVMKEIVMPTLAGMAAEGTPFVGFLYVGLMIGANGLPRVVEFNARLGDPEAQAILMRLRSDLLDVLLKAVEGQLAHVELEWDRRVAMTVVMAAHGYPENPRRGDLVTGLPSAKEDAMVFHAGTAMDDQQRLVTSGGRVLGATVLAESTRQAQQAVYEYMRPIHFDGAQYRTDIGHRAIKPR
jgi:phosphoribosylamine---glycine ligase